MTNENPNLASSARPSKTSGQSESFYQQRVEQCTVRESQLRRVDRVTSYARGVVFLISVILFAAGYAQPQARTLWFLLGGAVFVAFIATVGYHEQVLRNLTRTRLLRKINLQQLARISRSWSQVPVTHVDIREHARAVAHDLDLFGMVAPPWCNHPPCRNPCSYSLPSTSPSKPSENYSPHS